MTESEINTRISALEQKRRALIAEANALYAEAARLGEQVEMLRQLEESPELPELSYHEAVALWEERS